MTTENRTIEIPRHVEFSFVEDGFVLLDLRRGEYYGLDGVASTVWEALADGASPDEAAERITRRYAVDRQRARTDVEALIDRLATAGLLQRSA